MVICLKHTQKLFGNEMRRWCFVHSYFELLILNLMTSNSYKFYDLKYISYTISSLPRFIHATQISFPTNTNEIGDIYVPFNCSIADCSNRSAGNCWKWQVELIYCPNYRKGNQYSEPEYLSSTGLLTRRYVVTSNASVRTGTHSSWTWYPNYYYKISLS